MHENKKTNWKPSLFEYKSRTMYESNNIDWALLNVDTFFCKFDQSRDTLTTHTAYMYTRKDQREYIVCSKAK